jgi:hypothetical protein
MLLDRLSRRIRQSYSILLKADIIDAIYLDLQDRSSNLHLTGTMAHTGEVPD